jgi:hypothetical protein
LIVAALLVTANLDIPAQTGLLPRHVVSGSKDSALALIERRGLALLSMSDDTTKFDPCPVAKRSCAGDY